MPVVAEIFYILSVVTRFPNLIPSIHYHANRGIRHSIAAASILMHASLSSSLVTELARHWTRDFLQLRRQLFTDPAAQIPDFDGQLEKSAHLLNLIAGFYDHGTRVMSGAEQMAETGGQRTPRS